MNWRTTLVLVTVFALALGYAVFVEKPKRESVTPTPSAQYLWQVDAADLTGVRMVDNTAGRSVAFSKDATGVWRVTEPVPGEADQTQAGVESYNAMSLRIVTSLESVADLSQFGVLQPSYVLEVTSASQGTLIAHIGGKTPTGNGYYAIRPGESNAVVVSASTVDSLIGLLDRPPYAPTATPVPSETPAPTDAYASSEDDEPAAGPTSTP